MGREKQSASGLFFPARCQMSVVNLKIKIRWRSSDVSALGQPLKVLESQEHMAFVTEPEITNCHIQRKEFPVESTTLPLKELAEKCEWLPNAIDELLKQGKDCKIRGFRGQGNRSSKQRVGQHGCAPARAYLFLWDCTSCVNAVAQELNRRLSKLEFCRLDD